jgi:hypothetical protein
MNDIKKKNAAIISTTFANLFPSQLDKILVKFGESDDSMEVTVHMSSGKVRSFVVPVFDVFAETVELLYNQYITANPDYKDQLYFAYVAVEAALLPREVN